MGREIPTNPFEDLKDFTDLKTLVNHILESIRVKQITAYLPGIFDTKLIDDIDAILPVHYIVVGNATFRYIRDKAEYVLSNLHDRIEKIDRNSELSFADKLKLYIEVNKWLQKDYKYFNSMNAIRYMSSYQWKISYLEEIGGHTVQKEMNYPNSKIDLNEGHWNEIENNFVIRRDLVSEIGYLIELELGRLQDELSDTQYGWKNEKWEYELFEILIAIIASKRVDYIKGNERTFAHDFLALFGKPDTDFSYYKGKILDRSKPRGKNRTRARRSIFLADLQEFLEKGGTRKNIN